MVEIDFKQIISRLMDYKNISTQTELATILGTKQSNISKTIKNNSGKLQDLIAISDGMDLNYLITGHYRYGKKQDVVNSNSQPETIEDLRDHIRTLKDQVSTLKTLLNQRDQAIKEFRIANEDHRHIIQLLESALEAGEPFAPSMVAERPAPKSYPHISRENIAPIEKTDTSKDSKTDKMPGASNQNKQK